MAFVASSSNTCREGLFSYIFQIFVFKSELEFIYLFISVFIYLEKRLADDALDNRDYIRRT